MASYCRRYAYQARRTTHLLAFTSLVYALVCCLHALMTPSDSGSIVNHLKIEGGQSHFGSTTKRALGSALTRDMENACAGVEACISVHVFAYNRVDATNRLLEVLESSDYTGYAHPLPLVVHLDGPVTPDDGYAHLAIRKLAQTFQWTHGPKIVHVEDANRGLKASWLSAWTTPRPNDMMIAFEDDIAPSPLYFQWLLRIVTEYQLLEADKRDPSLLGVSLSPMRVDEISYPFRRWMTHEKVPAAFPVFLHAVPSSWGAAYFGGPWRDFLDFVDIRSSPAFYDVDDAALNLTGYGWHTQRGDPNLWLPNSRSNNWVKSWKRYMVEFAYGQGAYMLYPRIGNSSGFATSTFMQGEHVPNGGYHNPRVAPLAVAEDIDLGSALPPYKDLPLVDMHGNDITRRALARRGDALVEKVAHLGQHYSALTTSWGRRCLLDTVSGVEVSLSPKSHSSPTGDRYLVVAPQMGFSNQLIAILQSAVWAHTLGRKLVLPHIIWPRASNEHVTMDGWISFHEIFDPTAVTEQLPGLEFVHAEANLLSTWQPRRVVAIEPQPMFDRLYDAYFDALGWSGIERVDLHSRRDLLTTTDKVYQGLGSCSDETMVLDGLYQNPQSKALTENQRRQIWMSLFRPAPLVNYMIQTAREAILEGKPSGKKSKSNYGCLHVRLGDFSEMCAASQDAAPWLANLYKMGRRCNVSVEEMIDRANSLGLDKLVIISDDPTKLTPLLAGIQAGTSVWTGTNIRTIIEELLPPLRPHPTKQLIDVVSAVTEQHVCAQASRVVLNGFSTFSRSVLYQREKFKGVEYW